MKKLIILTAFLLATATTSTATSLMGASTGLVDEPAGGLIGGRVKIDNVNIERQGEQLHIQYRVTVPRGTVKSGYTMLVSPFVASASAEYALSLPAVVISGRSGRIARERGAWVAGMMEGGGDITYLSNGDSATLRATVPFQQWMYASWLGFNSAEGGCCSYSTLDDLFVAGLAADGRATASEPARWVPVTVADSLSTAFTFVLPASEYDEAEPFKIYDDERDNALVVYYHVSKYNIDRNYMDNAHTLSNLVNVIRMILASKDSDVERVVVAGFASPEGSFEFNDRLAFDRAVTIKRYIMDATGIADWRIQLHNGSEDWRGLRAMVARSNMPEKQQVLDIIDNVPVRDSSRETGRQAELMRLNGGVTWRRLLSEYFPYLRSGAFIRVYYNND